MAEHNYICRNGEFLKAVDPCLHHYNRAFRYGEMLTENMHAYATEAQFLDLHLNRLVSNMQFLGMPVPAYLNVSNVGELITRLLNKNRIFGGAAIRLTIFRDEACELNPAGTKASFLMESEKLETKQYGLNAQGFSIDICEAYEKASGLFSHIRQADALLYILADAYREQHFLDVVLLLNQYKRLVESTHANVFLVSGNTLFTPGTDQGCIPGVMRQVVITLALQNGFMVNDQSRLTPVSLEEAEEVFLTSAVTGIQWVGAYRQKRYYNRVAKMLTSKLNEQVFGH